MSSNISSSHMNYYSNMYSENKIFAIIKVRNKKKWTKEEDLKLIKLAEKNKEKHWKEISKNFLNKNPLQCFSRYKRIKPGIIKGTWSKEEDQNILSLVSIYGKSWSKLAKIMKSRNGKQIRDRFINVLDPDVKKGKFSYKEDRRIKELYLKYGPRWATIARGLPNRTPDMIKNRFHSSIKKYLHQKNILSKRDSSSKNEQSSKKTSDLENLDVNKNNSNPSSSNPNFSNSKSLLDKNYPNNFTNYSCPVQDSNINQNIFDNKYNQLYSNSDFDNRVNYGFNLSNQNKENNKDSILQNQEFRNNHNQKYFNFAKNLNSQTEFNNKGMIFNKIVSKINITENNEDANRTVSNSDLSEGNKMNSNSLLKIGKTGRLNENIENLFEYPDEHFQNTNFLNSNSNINNNAYKTNNVYDNPGAVRGFITKNQQVSCMVNNQIANSSNNNADYSKKINSNYFLQKHIMISSNNNNGIYNFDSKNTNNQMKSNTINENQNSKSSIINNENLNKGNNFKSNNILKNAQEFKIEKTNKNSNYNYLSKNNQNEINMKEINYGLNINNKLKNSNLNFQSNYEMEIESQNIKPNQQLFNENSRSTNLVTNPNASSNTSNIHSQEENENSSPENLKKNNGNPYFGNTFEENYQMNFLNFPDSPFRMKSPKYFDFEDFFNNN